MEILRHPRSISWIKRSIAVVMKANTKYGMDALMSGLLTTCMGIVFMLKDSGAAVFIATIFFAIVAAICIFKCSQAQGKENQKEDKTTAEYPFVRE